MGDFDEFQKFKNLLLLRQMLTKTDLAEPLARAQIQQHLSSGLASRASAMHSIFPVMRESGTTDLPPGLDEFSSLASPGITESHNRIVGNYQRKGRLDESLIGQRGAMTGAEDALRRFRELQITREPLVRQELSSRSTRNLSSANMMSVYANLRQRGYEDNSVKEAMRFAMARAGDQYQRALAERETNPNAPIPPAPTDTDLEAEAHRYLTLRGMGSSGRTAADRLGMDWAGNPTSGQDDVTGRVGRSPMVVAGGHGSPFHMDYSAPSPEEDPFGAFDQLPPDQADEGDTMDDPFAGFDQNIDFSPPGIGVGSMGNYQGPLQTQKALELKQILDRLNIGR